MASSRDRATRSPAGWLSRLAVVLGLNRYLRRMASQLESEERPEAVLSDQPIVDLADRALDLARDGRSDPEAVQVLRAGAGRHLRRLSQAAAYLRFEGSHLESRENDLANRLLLAAGEDRPVQLPSPDLVRRFDELESLERAPLSEAFEQLRHAQPSLGLLAAEVSGSPERFRTDEGWSELCDRLETLVGPESSSHDSLLRTQLAYGLARLYLAEVVGVSLE